MANVWYIGDAQERTLNFGASTFAWNIWNDWSIPESAFTAGQLAELDADPGFLLGQSGPRVSPPWTPDPSTGRHETILQKMVDIYNEIPARLSEDSLRNTFWPRLGKTYFVGEHGLKGDWAGGDANAGTGTNDTAALLALIAEIPDGSTIIFDASKVYRLDPIEIIGRDLTLDFNGCTVVTKTMALGVFGAAAPFITWTSQVSPEYNLNSSGFDRGATFVVTNPFGSVNDFSPGDYVILRDRYPVAAWDTGTNMSWVGVGEVAQVSSVSGSNGRINLRNPLRHQYRTNGGTQARVRRVIKPARPVIRNVGKIMDSNPGGAFTGDVETSGGHLFYFYGCINPRVEYAYAEGWQNHVVNFNSCLSPYIKKVEGRSPFQVGSGHGYICRMLHCVDGIMDEPIGYGARHVANYVGSVNCGSRRGASYAGAGVSFQTHGLQSRDSFSLEDTVVGGDSTGWSHGNPQFGADFGYRIVRPSYYGIQKGIIARSGSVGTHVVQPNIHTVLTGIEVAAKAEGTTIDLTGGVIEIFGSNSDSFAVSAKDVDSTGEFKPVDVTVIGPGKLVGERALVSLDTSGRADVHGERVNKAGAIETWDGTDWAQRVVDLSGNQTIAGNKKFNDLVGFYGTDPVAQPNATTDLGVLLAALGLRATGTAYPISTSGAVSLSGSFRTGANVRTSSVTLATTNAPNNMCDSTSGAITMTLPNTGTAGFRFLFKRMNAGANNVTIAAGASGSIEGASSIVLDAQYKWVEVMSTTTVGLWIVLGRG